jgi:hypothetical protein
MAKGMPCQGGFRGGQTAIVAAEQRPLRAGRSQKQETPAGGPAGVDGGQKRSCRRFGHREGFVPVAWKQEIASDGRRQLAGPPDRQMLIARISYVRLRPMVTQFKGRTKLLHGFQTAGSVARRPWRNQLKQQRRSTNGNRPACPWRRPAGPGIGASKLKPLCPGSALYINKLY